MERVPTLLETIKKLDLTLAGVSFHVGSDCNNHKTFYEALEKSKRVFKLANDICPEQFNRPGVQTILDIGGGFPGTNKANVKKDFEGMCRWINKGLVDFFPESEYPDLEIIAEPGRYFVAGAACLAVQIFGIDDMDQNHVRYYTNDGAFGSYFFVYYDMEFLPYIEQSNLNALAESKSDSESDEDNPWSGFFNSTVYGPTLCGEDRITDEIMMPKHNLNDWLFYPDMGAYSIANSTIGFCGMSLSAAIHYVIDEETEKFVMRKRAGEKDLVYDQSRIARKSGRGFSKLRSNRTFSRTVSIC